MISYLKIIIYHHARKHSEKISTLFKKKKNLIKASHLWYYQLQRFGQLFGRMQDPFAFLHGHPRHCSRGGVCEGGGRLSVGRSTLTRLTCLVECPPPSHVVRGRHTFRSARGRRRHSPVSLQYLHDRPVVSSVQFDFVPFLGWSASE